jgi:hypothetical protein
MVHALCHIGHRIHERHGVAKIFKNPLGVQTVFFHAPVTAGLGLQSYECGLTTKI